MAKGASLVLPVLLGCLLPAARLSAASIVHVVSTGPAGGPGLFLEHAVGELLDTENCKDWFASLSAAHDVLAAEQRPGDAFDRMVRIATLACDGLDGAWMLGLDASGSDPLPWKDLLSAPRGWTSVDQSGFTGGGGAREAAVSTAFSSGSLAWTVRAPR